MSGSRDVENCKVSVMREYEKKKKDRTKEEYTNMTKETEGISMKNVKNKIKKCTMNEIERK